MHYVLHKFENTTKRKGVSLDTVSSTTEAKSGMRDPLRFLGTASTAKHLAVLAKWSAEGRKLYILQH